MNRIVFIKGSNVSLIIPEKQDLEIMWKGINNVNISKFLGPIKHYTKEMEENFLDSMLKGDKKFFLIIENSSNKTIGGVGLNEDNTISRNGVIGISLYEEELFGKGYGTEALQLFLKYIFEYIGYNKVKLFVFNFNERAKKSYEKCGFKEVGYFKEEAYIMGKYVDSIAMEILASEYLLKKDY